jgi:hypothetical protein
VCDGGASQSRSGDPNALFGGSRRVACTIARQDPALRARIKPPRKGRVSCLPPSRTWFAQPRACPQSVHPADTTAASPAPNTAAGEAGDGSRSRGEACRTSTDVLPAHHARLALARSCSRRSDGTAKVQMSGESLARQRACSPTSTFALWPWLPVSFSGSIQRVGRIPDGATATPLTGRQSGRTRSYA